jgi:hypothetical protein
MSGITVICRHCGLPVERRRWSILGSTVCQRCDDGGSQDAVTPRVRQLQLLERSRIATLDFTTVLTPKATPLPPPKKRRPLVDVIDDHGHTHER